MFIKETFLTIDILLKHFRILQNCYAKEHPWAVASILLSSLKLIKWLSNN